MTTSPFYFQSSLVDGSLQIQVWLVAGTGADAADLDLDYNPALGSYTSFTPPAGWPAETNGETAGTVLVSMFDGGLGANAVATTDAGLLGTFTFALATNARQFMASLTSSSDLYDSDGNSISATPPAPLDVTLSTLCFCAGTLILTPAGQVPVENLQVGGNVTTWRGETRRISWIGTGRVLATRGRRSEATPVIVRKCALGENVPNRDLRVTKGHAFLLDGVLIPVEFLINYHSIVWDDHAQEVRLYHIELETHDILVANGAPAESYRDDGNRWLFRNFNPAWDLTPRKPCAPIRTGGPIVDAVWERLLTHADTRRRAELTSDPDLHLAVDGMVMSPTSRSGNYYTFFLAGAPHTVRLISRDAVPAELGLIRDFRSLGVALKRVIVRKGTWIRLIEGDDASLTDGFHPFETETGVRWTNGDAKLPAKLFNGLSGPLELVVQVEGETHYPLGVDARRAA